MHDKSLVLLLLSEVASSCLLAQPSAASSEAGQVYRQASPAVVMIEARNPERKEGKQGSGFLISADGKILTNYHVIAHCKEATVRLANGDAYDTVEVLDVDKRKDIALLKIKAVDLPFLALGRSSTVAVGDSTYALGNPLGLKNTLSNGIVSGIRPMDGYKYFQVSVPISHGSSGGPLFNSKAEVIAIATAGLEDGQNLNFAVPIDYARGMLSSTNPQPLSSIYEPEPEQVVAPGQQQSAKDSPNPPKTSSAETANRPPAAGGSSDELKQQGLAFIEKRLRIWTEEDAKVVLGDPIRHRYAYDPQKSISGDIFAYRDSTGGHREFELSFDIKTKKLTNIYAFPWNLTWTQCKQMWGEDIKTIKNVDGTRFYVYKNRRVNVLVAKDGKVISLGLY